jgi:hypothetical protein
MDYAIHVRPTDVSISLQILIGDSWTIKKQADVWQHKEKLQHATANNAAQNSSSLWHDSPLDYLNRIIVIQHEDP